MTKPKRPPTNRTRKRSAPRSSAFVPRLYHLVIPCRDEHHQRTLYHQLTRAGHPCRVITL